MSTEKKPYSVHTHEIDATAQERKIPEHMQLDHKPLNDNERPGSQQETEQRLLFVLCDALQMSPAQLKKTLSDDYDSTEKHTILRVKRIAHMPALKAAVAEYLKHADQGQKISFPAKIPNALIINSPGGNGIQHLIHIYADAYKPAKLPLEDLKILLNQDIFFKHDSNLQVGKESEYVTETTQLSEGNNMSAEYEHVRGIFPEHHMNPMQRIIKGAIHRTTEAIEKFQLARPGKNGLRAQDVIETAEHLQEKLQEAKAQLLERAAKQKSIDFKPPADVMQWLDDAIKALEKERLVKEIGVSTLTSFRA